MVGAPREEALWLPAHVPEGSRELESAEIPGWLAEVLSRRGVASADEARAFLEPDLTQLHDPLTVPGIPEALELLEEARAKGQTVAVIGDYDVDGVTATALLVAVFRACGLRVEPILPRRLEEGYGFQPSHVEKAVLLGASLIVTADCGSTAVAGAEAAQAAGIDLIVTDHHLSEKELPERVVEINLKRRAGDYPDDRLSGAGVALKLAMAFARRQGREIDPSALLRIAALGTICDMVPLAGENRAIAALGLEALPATPSPGLQALIRQAGVKPPFTASDVGFRLGPRINAAGRMANAEPALELLLTRDKKTASRHALDLDEWNRKRRESETRVYEEALEQLESRAPRPHLLVAWSPEWHRGVVGIAAGRIARTLRRPTLLLSVTGDSATGSGRSLPGIHLYDFLSAWRDDLERFGGHAQAVGLTAATVELEALRDLWEARAAESWSSDLFRRRYEYEIHLSPSAVGEDLLETLERLEPYGEGNKEPLIRVGPLSLTDPPRLFGKGHLSARAGDGQGAGLRLLGWGWRSRMEDLTGRFDALGYLERDRYLHKPVLRLQDVRPAEAGETLAERRMDSRADE